MPENLEPGSGALFTPTGPLRTAPISGFSPEIHPGAKLPVHLLSRLQTFTAVQADSAAASVMTIRLRDRSPSREGASRQRRICDPFEPVLAGRFIAGSFVCRHESGRRHSILATEKQAVLVGAVRALGSSLALAWLSFDSSKALSSISRSAGRCRGPADDRPRVLLTR
jgi:hypothetical protein